MKYIRKLLVISFILFTFFFLTKSDAFAASCLTASPDIWNLDQNNAVTFTYAPVADDPYLGINAHGYYADATNWMTNVTWTNPGGFTPTSNDVFSNSIYTWYRWYYASNFLAGTTYTFTATVHPASSSGITPGSYDISPSSGIAYCDPYTIAVVSSVTPTPTSTPTPTATPSPTPTPIPTDWALDEGFGTGGKVFASFGHTAYTFDTLTQPNDQKAIVVGYASSGNHNNWVIARYNVDGSLDQNFGTNGMAIQDFGFGNIAHGVGLQSTGKIIVGGASPYERPDVWTVGRYNSDGSLDTSFGANGIASTSVPLNGSGSVLLDLAVQSNDKIVTVGYNGTNSSTNDVVVVRYNADGSLDTTFGTSGIVATHFEGVYDRGGSVVVQPDGKIIVFGDYDFGDGGNFSSIFLLRYNTDGALDPSFGNNGVVTDHFGNQDGGRDIALGSDGKIVVTGQVIENGVGKTYAVRYNTNGSRDTGFASNGLFVDAFSGNNSRANTLIIDPDGKILLGGGNGDPAVGGGEQGNFAIRRLNIDGTLDTSFGTNGSIVTALGTGYNDIHGLTLTNDGKILAVGEVCDTFCDWALARYVNTAFPTPTPSPTNTPTPTPTPIQLTSLSPAKIWVGLKNSDDVGVKFDLLAEIYKDSTLITSREVDSVLAGSSGFNNAKLNTLTFNTFSPIDFPSGSQLKIKVYVRNACTGSGHNSGIARLWYNDSQANSQFDATIGSSDTNYFLRDSFLLAANTGSVKKTIDVAAGAKCSSFKSFGTWTITP